MYGLFYFAAFSFMYSVKSDIMLLGNATGHNGVKISKNPIHWKPYSEVFESIGLKRNLLET